MVVSFLLEHKMHVTGPVAMPSQLHQQLPHRPIVRNRIRHRHNRFEPEHPGIIAVHHGSLIRSFSTRVLHIIESFAVRFPDIDLDSADRLASSVFEGAEDETGLAVRVVGDHRAVGEGLGLVGMEGAEDGAFGAGGGFGVVDGVDEEREAEDVGEEDELLRIRQLESCVSGSAGLPRTCRTSVQIWPTDVRKRRPVIHSSWLRRVSRAKSWRCWTMRSSIYFKRGFGHFELISLTLSVMLSMVRSFKGGTSTLEGSIVRWERVMILLEDVELDIDTYLQSKAKPSSRFVMLYNSETRYGMTPRWALMNPTSTTAGPARAVRLLNEWL